MYLDMDHKVFIAYDNIRIVLIQLKHIFSATLSIDTTHRTPFTFNTLI